MNFYPNYNIALNNYNDVDLKVQRWMEHRGDYNSSNIQTLELINPNINEFKMFLKILMDLNKQMKDTLVTYVGTINDVERSSLKSQLETLIAQISTFHDIFNNERYVNAVQIKLRNIKKKRNYITKKKARTMAFSENKERRRAEIEKSSDALLLYKKEEETLFAERKTVVDLINEDLSRVEHRKNEIDKRIQLIESLLKLRSLRLEIGSREIIFDDKDDCFESSMRALICELQSELKVVCCERDAIVAKVRLMNDGLQLRNEKHVKVEVKKTLFGDDNPEKDWFYDDTQLNLRRFVDIRSQWDSFITDDGGSFLPITWVLPSDPEHESWQPYLE